MLEEKYEILNENVQMHERNFKMDFKEEELDLVKRLEKRPEDKCRLILLKLTTFRKNKIWYSKNRIALNILQTVSAHAEFSRCPGGSPLHM